LVKNEGRTHPDSLAYLGSPAAVEAIAQNTYWPKWTAPWWHILLAHERGDSPDPVRTSAARELLEAMRARYIPAFLPEEFPDLSGTDNSFCFCALGTIWPAFEEAGIDIEKTLPWVREWVLRYSLPNGGASCDDRLYRQENPGSSIVATTALLEFFVESRLGPNSPAELKFTHGLAKDLIDRKLLHSLPGTVNEEELEDEADWRLLCFPRFYFYDVLRGLTAVTRYAERTETVIPYAAISEAVELLEAKAKRGPLTVERDAISEVGGYVFKDGKRIREERSSLFPALAENLKIGKVSTALQSEWEATRARIAKLRKKGLLT
jgi:hypothetical protein